jgi:hypothetical protein
MAVAAAAGCMMKDCRLGAVAAAALGLLSGQTCRYAISAGTIWRSAAAAISAANSCATESSACCALSERAASAAASAATSMAWTVRMAWR